MNKIQTAEELSKKYIRGDDAVISKHVKFLMIEFAKLHVQAALKAAKNFEVDGCGCGESSIIEEHINNAYSLENII